MLNFKGVAGSYRDPAGKVFLSEDRQLVFRTVSEVGRKQYEWVRDQGLFTEAGALGLLVSVEELEQIPSVPEFLGAAYVLQHERIPYISYPYEWSFFQLQGAAIKHLELQIFLLERDAVLSDATAFNMQFIGCEAIFIDALSIRQYKNGEHWIAHNQFCEQFLNPLLLRALKGCAHNDWYRGSMNGVATADISALLSMTDKFSLNIFSHVLMLDKLNKSALKDPDLSTEKAKHVKSLPKSGYLAILKQLKTWIEKLVPKDTGPSVWGEYSDCNTYENDEEKEKSRLIAEFCSRHQPGILFDIGCNSGNYSRASLSGGAKYVVGFDFDQLAVERAYCESRKSHPREFLPLWLDASNPSPSQGWNQLEREGFRERARADAVIALAFEHHLAIAKNIPLSEVIEWLVNIAPVGMIEFVPKNDPTVQQLLSLREDIFPEYSLETFLNELGRITTIVSSINVSATGRTLVEFSR